MKLQPLPPSSPAQTATADQAAANHVDTAAVVAQARHTAAAAVVAAMPVAKARVESSIVETQVTGAAPAAADQAVLGGRVQGAALAADQAVLVGRVQGAALAADQAVLGGRVQGAALAADQAVLGGRVQVVGQAVPVELQPDPPVLVEQYPAAAATAAAAIPMPAGPVQRLVAKDMVEVAALDLSAVCLHLRQPPRLTTFHRTHQRPDTPRPRSWPRVLREWSKLA